MICPTTSRAWRPAVGPRLDRRVRRRLARLPKRGRLGATWPPRAQRVATLRRAGVARRWPSTDWLTFALAGLPARNVLVAAGEVRSTRKTRALLEVVKPGARSVYEFRGLTFE